MLLSEIGNSDGPRQPPLVKFFHGCPHLDPLFLIQDSLLAVVGPRPMDEKEIHVTEAKPSQATLKLLRQACSGMLGGILHVGSFSIRGLRPKPDRWMPHLRRNENICPAELSSFNSTAEHFPNVALVAIHVCRVYVTHASFERFWKSLPNHFRFSSTFREERGAKANLWHFHTIGKLSHWACERTRFQPLNDWWLIAGYHALHTLCGCREQF
mmetsp:Transcript_2406/g.4405  ORF Transcript_2406/g.4405 Transcript_2406/m.4405 type:complete len:212 (-) Transcript_2406:53-688(-)